MGDTFTGSDEDKPKDKPEEKAKEENKQEDGVPLLDYTEEEKRD